MLNKILYYLRKFGILKSGSDSYKGKGSNSISDFYGNKDKKDKEEGKKEK